MKSWVVVTTRKGFTDPAGTGMVTLCRESGVVLEHVEVAALYELEGELSKAETGRVAKELLADPVTQDAEVVPAGEVARAKGAVVVDVWLRPEVADPVAPSVERGAADLGITLKARVGQRYLLRGPVTPETAVDLAWRTVANPLLHRCTGRAG